MADLPLTQQAAQPLVYRPISGLALVGFLLSCLFAGLVLVSTLVALVQGLPVFLPSAALWLAVAAASVCFLAQMRIRNAEGTLAGMALARWGLWLSVLVGVTYFVYIWVTGLALAKQADDFLRVKSSDDTGFFPRLESAAKNRTELYQAFLLSLPVTSRGGSKAANEDAMLAQYDQPGKDGESGNISKFSKHPLVLAVMQDPDTVHIEALGVVDWKYEGNCYHVVRNYRFTTAEFVIETAVPVQSTEGTGEGEQRKWFVNIMRIPSLKSITPTPLGKQLSALRAYSKLFLQKWQTDVGAGTRVPEYNDADGAWAKILSKKDIQGEHVRKTVAEIFRGERKIPAQTSFTTDEHFAPWSKADGRILIHHTMRMLLPAEGSVPYFNLDLDFVMATKNPVDLAAPLSLPIHWDLRTISVVRAASAPRMTGSP